jgi:hypothetical protein
MRAYLVVLMLGSGAGILGFWAFMVGTRKVPEIREGKPAIWFHIGAEVLLAVLLIAGAIALLVEAGTAQLALAGMGLGALLYTAINSPGYYVDLGQPVIVGMFAGLVALSGLGIVFLLLMA